MGRKTEQTLFKMEMHTISGHEKMSTSLIIREMLTKTTVRYHLIPVRMAIIKKTTNNKYRRGM